jgi:hypothetical protein
MMTSPRIPEQEKPETNSETPVGPDLEEQDWDAIEAGELEPVSVPDNGDIRYGEKDDEKSGELPEEDDDNPYQESDAALPEDAEETAISRNLADADRRDEP